METVSVALGLGTVTEHENSVELNADRFVRSEDQHGMLTFGDKARDHLLAARSKTRGGQPAVVERSVFAKGVTVEDCERIHQIARVRWNALHDELVRELTGAFAAAPKSAHARMRIGIYAYFENADSSVSLPQVGPPEPGA